MSRHFYLALAIVVVLGLGIMVALRALTPPREPEDRLYVPKKAVITPEILQLQTYVRINTSNPPGNETAGARFLLNQLQQHGISGELIEAAPGRGSIYARIRGTQPGQGLLLLHHIDVVRARDADWIFPPFSGHIDSNQMYGRGTLDTKGIGICHLDAFINLAASKRKPLRDVVFLATADEESGGALGMGWLLEHRPDIFEGVRFAINEGGVTETIKNEISYFGIETGSKQFVNVDMKAPSREALQKARIALEPWFQPLEPDRVLPEVAEYFHDLAPHRLESALLLNDIRATIKAQRFWLLPAQYKELTQNNLFVLGVRQTKDGFIMPAMLLDLPDEDPQRRMAWLREMVKPYGVRVELSRIMGPTPISSTSTPFFVLMVHAIRQQYGNVPVGPILIPRVTTDCRYLRARGVQCYGIWPFPVDLYQTLGIHGRNESIRLDWFVGGVGMTRRLVMEYALGK
jgi:acetylornithine deacetylase/succinyl-diaminopimelate desuccinylase-like protein